MSRYSNVEVYLILNNQAVRTGIRIKDQYGLSLVTDLALHSCFGLVSIQRLHVLLTYDAVKGTSVFCPIWVEQDDGELVTPADLLSFFRRQITLEELGRRIAEADLAVYGQLGNG